MRRNCPCGGVCHGNAERCAYNVRLQAMWREAVDRHDREVEERRRNLRAVEDEQGDDIQGAAEAFMRTMESK